jgi:hypothetical protein
MAKGPNPLAPGHIPGQNPATPERLPGHTGYFGRKEGRRAAPWIVLALILAVAVLFGLGVIGH